MQNSKVVQVVGTVGLVAAGLVIVAAGLMYGIARSIEESLDFSEDSEDDSRQD